MDYLDALALEKQRNDLYKDDEESVCFQCDKCRANIYDGQTYYECEIGDLCEECFDEMQTDEKRECERVAGEDDEY